MQSRYRSGSLAGEVSPIKNDFNNFGEEEEEEDDDRRMCGGPNSGCSTRWRDTCPGVVRSGCPQSESR